MIPFSKVFPVIELGTCEKTEVDTQKKQTIIPGKLPILIGFVFMAVDLNFWPTGGGKQRIVPESADSSNVN